jgi:hypothetical protein
MGVRFTGVLSLIAIASPIVFIGSANVANAQSATTQPTAEETQTIPQAFENAYFRFDEDFYRNQQVPRNLTWFLGPFPENEIAGDGKAINSLYRDALAQQGSDGPTIRTPDAENPYQSSLLSAPIVPAEEPIPPAFSSPFSRSPVTSGGGNRDNGNSGGGNSGGNSAPIPALW